MTTALRTIDAVRYVLPLREGGSVPALLEGDDDGLYVVKLRGASQGAKALLAELVAGELARASGISVPEIVLVRIDEALAKSEPDPELCLALEKSAGTNVGLDFLPGSLAFDRVADGAPDATLASRIVLFDGFVANVDRTARNPNLLTWHGRLFAIDHGAALYFHHGWTAEDPLDGSADPFGRFAEHVLLPFASDLAHAERDLDRVLTDARIDAIVAQIPDAFLDPFVGFRNEDDHRAAYGQWLRARKRALPLLTTEAERARTMLV